MNVFEKLIDGGLLIVIIVVLVAGFGQNNIVAFVLLPVVVAMAYFRYKSDQRIKRTTVVCPMCRGEGRIPK